MRIAAYNRGTQAIRDQIDQEQASKQKDYTVTAQWWTEREHEKLTARIASLESDLEHARACIARLRAERAVTLDELAESRRRCELVKQMWFSGNARLIAVWNHISWLKGLLSFCGVTREDVERYENA